MRRIDELHLEFPFAGSRMLRDLLRGEGHALGRLHVATLMRRMGITALYRRLKTSRRHPAYPVFPYLLRSLVIERPNQVWAMDLARRWKDNVFVERFWKSLKYEEVYLHAYASVSEARAGIARYISFYSTWRPHDALRRRTPDQAYTAGRLHEAAAAPRGMPLISAA
jgi:transposase InsO family protein